MPSDINKIDYYSNRLANSNYRDILVYALYKDICLPQHKSFISKPGENLTASMCSIFYNFTNESRNIELEKEYSKISTFLIHNYLESKTIFPHEFIKQDNIGYFISSGLEINIAFAYARVESDFNWLKDKLTPNGLIYFADYIGRYSTWKAWFHKKNSFPFDAFQIHITGGDENEKKILSSQFTLSTNPNAICIPKQFLPFTLDELQNYNSRISGV